MTPEELRAIMDYLMDRVKLGPGSGEGSTVIAFIAPTVEEMIDAGLAAGGAKKIIGAPWWDEMQEDIVETPEMCEPGDSPEQILQYARDVVSEYIRKRFKLEEA